MGDRKPAPTILAKPLPVSIAESTPSPMSGLLILGAGEAAPFLSLVSAVEIELVRRPHRSLDGDLER